METDAMSLSAEKKIESATRTVKAMVALVLAITALIAAVGTAISGIIYIRKGIEQATVDREKLMQTRAQAREVADGLGTDVETLSEQIQQNYEDLSVLRDYVSTVNENRVSQPVPTVRPFVQPTPTYAPTGAAPLPSASAPPPPELSPPPRFVKSVNGSDVFKD
jgi:hypothetical protein